ncbi:MAG: PEP-CTERM sorting domain-containing protein [Candidatus Eisenbacteria sp.]|nr:PEP-CTERM sorting domain-containing protein [Candidatus Eisenbacteria bacterium]
MTGMASALLVNGGFEIGDFTGWTVNVPHGASAGVVANHTGWGGTFYTPVEGSWFALLKTDGPATYTTARQSLSLPAGGWFSGHAAFDWRDYDPYNDVAYVKIYDGSMALVATPWSESGVGHPDYWDGPWTPWSWTATAPDTYTLELGVANIGDSVLDSYGLFDANVGVIPEPTTMLLLGLGLVGLSGLGRKKIFKRG